MKRDFVAGHLSRLLLLLYAVMTCGLAAAGYFYYSDQKNQMKQHDQRELSAVADLKVRQIATWRKECIGDASSIFSNPATARVLRSLIEDPADAERETGLLKWTAALSSIYEYEAAWLLDARGRVRLPLVGAGKEAGAHSNLTLEEALNTRRAVLSDLHRSPEWPAIHMDLVVPVPAAEPARPPVGAVLLQIDPHRFLYPLVQSWPTPSRTAETLLVRREGAEIVYLNELRHRRGAALSLRLPVASHQLIASRALTGYEGVLEGVDYRGKAVLAATRSLPGAPWFLIAKVETDEVYEHIRERAWLVAVIVGLMLAASGCMIAFVWRTQHARFYRRQYEAELERNALVAHYSYLSRYANDIILLMDSEGRIVEVNDRAVASYLYSREELLALKIVDLRAPATLATFKAEWDRITPESGYIFETVHRRKDGSTFPVEVSSRVMDVQGVLFRQSIIRDITERKRAEEEIRRNQHLLARILETTPNLIYIYDLVDRRNVYTNRHVAAFLGYSAEQLMAMGAELMSRLLHPDDTAAVAAHHGRMASAPDNRVFEIEYRMRHAGGEWSWLHSRDVAFARGAGGQVTQILGAAEDISERKRAEEERAWQSRTNEAMADLASALLSESSIEEVSDMVLARARALTDSAIGYVGYIDRDTGDTIAPTLTRDVWPQCDISGKSVVFRNQMGLGAWVLRNKQPLMTNDAAADPRSCGTPPGHVPIKRFLCAPAMIGDVLAGNVSVANPPRDYTERDLAVIQRLARLYALALRRKQDLESLRASEARLAHAQRLAHLGNWEVDLATGEGIWSEEVYRIFGQSPESFNPTAANFYECVHPDDREAVRLEAERRAASAKPGESAYRIVRPDGSERFVEERFDYVHDAEGKPVRAMGTVRDLTDYKRLEEQLRHSQKMEAIGRLAGGVAHDFNNLLTIINGYSQFALERLEDGHPVRRDVIEIHEAGERAAALTRQLLAFSRRQLLQPQVLDLNTIVNRLEKMLRRLIGEDVELTTDLDRNLRRVKVDAGQIEQVIMNLAVNARDAMPEGGRLAIETANVWLDRLADLPPGFCVRLSISDTGAGISAETQAHIFEPFFTTKPKGKGTGLGLSTVYGIVKQSGGEIQVRSEPGRGAAFDIFLPAVDSAVVQESQAAPASAGGSETVLVVEDEDGVRSLTSKILQNAGYTVLEAANAEEAMVVCARYAGTIHAMVTDVVMPGLSGRELARQLEALRPAMRVLYISGYTDDAIVQHGVLDPGLEFIQKPFTPKALAAKVAGMMR